MMEVYCDYSATTPIHPAVFQKMLPYMKDEYGNPSSIHKKGRSAKYAIEEARQIIADSIKCDKSEIIFTSGGTEGDNLAIKSIAQLRGKNGLYITSQIEHPAVLNTFKQLEREGYNVKYLKVSQDTGRVSLQKLKEILDSNDKINMVSIMAVNNETGIIQPLLQIRNLLAVKEHQQKSRIIFHTDAVQLIGKETLDISDMNYIDLLSVSGHKFGAQKGIGFLYVKKELNLIPQINGGGQEKRNKKRYRKCCRYCRTRRSIKNSEQSYRRV